MSYSITKTFGHNAGLSATFRQWAAENTHCRFLHGYALKVKIILDCSELDHRNWVYSFGDFKPLKAWLEETFDHKTLIAQDDPFLDHFQHMADLGLIQLVVVKKVGCEAFAQMIYDKMTELLADQGLLPDNDEISLKRMVWVREVTVSEHEGNSATFYDDGL